MFPTIFALVATVTSVIVGSMEIEPGLCRVERIIDGIVYTEVVSCKTTEQV